MKCIRILLPVILLLLSSAMIGCSSRIKVMLRDSVTHEPIVGAHVRASYLVTFDIITPNTVDSGITNKDGVVILYLAEKGPYAFLLHPYYSLESREKSIRSWSMNFDHPARYGNTDWVQVNTKYSGEDYEPEIEIKLEKY